jgi:hypothetical protein
VCFCSIYLSATLFNKFLSACLFKLLVFLIVAQVSFCVFVQIVLQVSLCFTALQFSVCCFACLFLLRVMFQCHRKVSQTEKYANNVGLGQKVFLIWRKKTFSFFFGKHWMGFQSLSFALTPDCLQLRHLKLSLLNPAVSFSNCNLVNLVSFRSRVSNCNLVMRMSAASKRNLYCSKKTIFCNFLINYKYFITLLYVGVSLSLTLFV